MGSALSVGVRETRADPGFPQQGDSIDAGRFHREAESWRQYVAPVEQILATTQEQGLALRRSGRRARTAAQRGEVERELNEELEFGLESPSHAFKMDKHFRLQITPDAFTFERDLEAIRQEAALDGVYVIRTSVPQEALPAAGTVEAYKNLSHVERAFRSCKTVDLQVRPMHHRREDRVRAHVFLCMLAYYVEWHMRRPLAPILFDDHDRAAARVLRSSIVAPAQRSPGALMKAQSKRTANGEPVHSFRTLLKDLATLTRNRVRVGSASFEQLSAPTPLQQRAFDLLQVRP
jgi:hypothetical protein